MVWTDKEISDSSNFYPSIAYNSYWIIKKRYVISFNDIEEKGANNVVLFLFPYNEESRLIMDCYQGCTTKDVYEITNQINQIANITTSNFKGFKKDEVVPPGVSRVRYSLSLPNNYLEMNFMYSSKKKRPSFSGEFS